MSLTDVYDAIVAGPWADIQDHLPFLRDTVRGYQSPVVIELGVRTGLSTAALLSGALEAGGEVWSCDIDVVSVPSQIAACESWHFRHGDSVNPETLQWMPAKADVIFIDTSHTFEQTLAELRAYHPRLREGGIMLLHDTQWMAPAISLPAPGGPVAAALDAFCDEKGITWENRRSEPGFYGLGVLRPA